MPTHLSKCSHVPRLRDTSIYTTICWHLRWCASTSYLMLTYSMHGQHLLAYAFICSHIGIINLFWPEEDSFLHDRHPSKLTSTLRLSAKIMNSTQFVWSWMPLYTRVGPYFRSSIFGICLTLETQNRSQNIFEPLVKLHFHFLWLVVWLPGRTSCRTATRVCVLPIRIGPYFRLNRFPTCLTHLLG